MVDWKTGLELALSEKAMKSLEFLRTSSTGTLGRKVKNSENS